MSDTQAIAARLTAIAEQMLEAIFDRAPVLDQRRRDEFVALLRKFRADEDVWIVTERETGGIRGAYRSYDAAEAEIATVCANYSDLTRQDFNIITERIRD